MDRAFETCRALAATILMAVAAVLVMAVNLRAQDRGEPVDLSKKAGFHDDYYSHGGLMMRVFIFLSLLFLPYPVPGQELPAPDGEALAVVKAANPSSGKAEPQERWFFPRKDWIYGFTEFDIAPPHNEPDPNLCAPNAGDYGAAHSRATS